MENNLPGRDGLHQNQVMDFHNWLPASFFAGGDGPHLIPPQRRPLPRWPPGVWPFPRGDQFAVETDHFMDFDDDIILMFELDEEEEDEEEEDERYEDERYGEEEEREEDGRYAVDKEGEEEEKEEMYEEEREKEEETTDHQYAAISRGNGTRKRRREDDEEDNERSSKRFKR